MAKIHFLGVGEPFDADNLTTSFLFQHKRLNFVFDLGYSIHLELWKKLKDDVPDYIFISHMHADHYFGLVPFLGNLILKNFRGRKLKKKVKIITHRENINKIKEAIYVGFGKFFLERLNKVSTFIPVKAGQELEFDNLHLSFEETRHAVRNLAIKVSWKNKSFVYSGDGVILKKTMKLIEGSSVLLQNTFLETERAKGDYRGRPALIHESIVDAIEISRSLGVKNLYCLHLEKNLRKRKLNILKRRYSKLKDLKVFFPEKSSIITI